MLNSMGHPELMNVHNPKKSVNTAKTFLRVLSFGDRMKAVYVRSSRSADQSSAQKTVHLTAYSSEMLISLCAQDRNGTGHGEIRSVFKIKGVLTG